MLECRDSWQFCSKVHLDVIPCNGIKAIHILNHDKRLLKQNIFQMILAVLWNTKSPKLMGVKFVTLKLCQRIVLQ